MGVLRPVYAAARGLAVAGTWLAVAWDGAGSRGDDATGVAVLAAVVAPLSFAWAVADGAVAARRDGRDLVSVAASWVGSTVVAAVVVATFAPTPDGRLDLSGILDAGGFVVLLLVLSTVPAVLGAVLGAGVRAGVRWLLSPGPRSRDDIPDTPA